MTIFQKIIDGEIPARRVFEDDKALAFYDIEPQAPEHVLVIPKKPIVSMAHIDEQDAALLGHLMWVAAQVAKKLNLDEEGYRLVVNTGAHGGQTVDHLHIHILGGRAMQWPPG